MKERNKDKKGLHYQEMDVRDMKDFEKETFDITFILKIDEIYFYKIIFLLSD